jgi:hypothetical protein
VVLRLVHRLALRLDNGSDALHEEIRHGFGRLPQVDGRDLPVARVPGDSRDEARRWIGQRPKALVPLLPLGARCRHRLNMHSPIDLGLRIASFQLDALECYVAKHVARCELRPFLVRGGAETYLGSGACAS